MDPDGCDVQPLHIAFAGSGRVRRWSLRRSSKPQLGSVHAQLTATLQVFTSLIDGTNVIVGSRSTG
jgi:hypothetical protein